MANKNENLIMIDEVIAKAEKSGVNFGKGDPRNRLRYYTKIGLLPHAQRKSFNGLPPNGAYPAEVISILVEIDKKVKEGKSIQAIKRELAEKREIPPEKISPPIHILYKPFEEEIVEEEKAEEILPVEEKPRILKENFLVKILGTALLILIFITTIFALDSWLNEKKIFSFLLASLQPYFRLAQEISPPPLVEKPTPITEIPYQPYLTINAETDINAPLNVKEKVTTPQLILTKEEFKGSLTVATLSADQNYIFPDLSGTICLTTGNCVGLGGEIIGVGGLPNRVAKFISPTRVGVSSISDFYPGIAMTIDALGRVGVGTRTPGYALHVAGRIQATGDICTALAGGKCLSELRPAAPPIFFPPSPVGVGGSGTAGYLPIWTAGTTLGNSIIYQSNGNIGIGTTAPSQKLTVAGNGLFQGILALETNTLPQFVLRYDDDNYFKISVTSNGTTFFDSSSGKIQAATSTIFYTANGHPIRKSGEEILRTAVPIFLYDFPAQTASTSYVKISKHFASTSEISLPEAMEGTARVYRLAIKYIDDIATSAFSDWRIVNQASTTIYATTILAGKNMNTFKEGVPYITKLLNIPDNDWQVEVKVPSGKTIRIFNIFLLVFDQIQ